MSTHKSIELICCVAFGLALLLTLVFFQADRLGIQATTKEMGYESRLFDTSTVHTIDIVMDDWGLYLAVEGVEESFLERNYGNDYGELYKPDSISMDADREMGEKPENGDFPTDGDFPSEMPEGDFSPENMPQGMGGGGFGQNMGKGGFGGDRKDDSSPGSAFPEQSDEAETLTAPENGGMDRHSSPEEGSGSERSAPSEQEQTRESTALSTEDSAQ